MKGSWARWWFWKSQYEGRPKKEESTDIQQLLQRVDDLVRLGVAEDVDDLAVPGLPLGIHEVSQRVRLQGRGHMLCGWLRPRLGIQDRLQLDMARIRLAHHVRSDSLLEERLQVRPVGIEAGEVNWRRRRPVAESCERARHGRGELAMPMAVAGQPTVNAKMLDENARATRKQAAPPPAPTRRLHGHLLRRPLCC